MLIRSQDKTMITDNFTVYIVEWYGKFEIISGSEAVLARYSTEEKAIKVLDMICEWVQENSTLRIGEGIYTVTRNVVFQIPQDSEVE